MRKTLIVEHEGVKLVLKSPTSQQTLEAKKVANRAFHDALTSGAFLKRELEEVLRNRGIWNDEKFKQLTEIDEKIIEGEKQLRRGGKTKTGEKFSKEDAKKLAIDMRLWRLQRLLLMAERNEYNAKTADAQADDAEFDKLFSMCLYTEDGRPYFSSLDDFLTKKDEPLIRKCLGQFMYMHYGIEPDYEKNHEENKFLKQYGFVDDNMRLVNEDGEYVDEHGRRIDEDGFLLDEAGNRVDEDGNRYDENGELIEDFTPFDD